MDENPKFKLEDHPPWLGEAIPGTLQQIEDKYIVHLYPREARALILKGDKVQTQVLEDGRIEFFKTNLTGRKIPLGISKIQKVRPNKVELVRFWTTSSPE